MMREQTITTPATTFASNTIATIPGFVSPALMVGGTTWIAYYGMWIWSGISTGAQPAFDTSFGMFVSVLFMVALIGINGGLVGMGLRFREQAAGFGNAGLAFALFALLSTIYGLFGRVLLGSTPGFPGGFGVMGSCLAATLLGIAAWRSGALSRRNTYLLLVIGIVTFPLIIAITAILPNLPSWVVDEMPFAISGAAWIVFGTLVKRQ